MSLAKLRRYDIAYLAIRAIPGDSIGDAMIIWVDYSLDERGLLDAAEAGALTLHIVVKHMDAPISEESLAKAVRLVKARARWDRDEATEVIHSLRTDRDLMELAVGVLHICSRLGSTDGSATIELLDVTVPDTPEGLT